MTHSASQRPRTCSATHSVARVATEESFAAHGRALAHAEAAGDQVTRRDDHRAHRIPVSASGRPRSGRRSPASTSSESATANDPMLDAGLSRCRALLLAMAGRFDEAHEHILASDPILDRADQSVFSLTSRWIVAEAKELAGDAAGARQELLAAFLSMRDAERRRTGWDARALRAAAAARASLLRPGRLGRRRPSISPTARRSTNPSHPRARSTPSSASPPGAGSQRTAGRLAEALGLARQGVELAERSGLAELPSQGLARARRGTARERPDTERPTPPSPRHFASTRRRETSPPSRDSGRRGLNFSWIDDSVARRSVRPRSGKESGEPFTIGQAPPRRCPRSRPPSPSDCSRSGPPRALHRPRGATRSRSAC